MCEIENKFSRFVFIRKHRVGVLCNFKFHVFEGKKEENVIPVYHLNKKLKYTWLNFIFNLCKIIRHITPVFDFKHERCDTIMLT